MFTKLSHLFRLRRQRRPHRPAPARPARPHRFVPLLELLEQRDVPSTLSLVGPANTTYGNQASYTADLAGAVGPGGEANGTIHLFVDNVEQASHTLTPADFSGSDAIYSFSLSKLSAGTHSVSVTYDGDTDGLPNVAGNAPVSTTVAPRLLTVNATARNKVYDGTTNASVTLGDDRVAGDTFTDTYTSATFSDPNVNFYSSKTVTVSGIAISGPDAADYTLADSTTTTTANIIPRTATLTGLVANDKVYDGTQYTTVNTSGATITGVLPQDMQYFSFDVSGAQGYFRDANAGNGKTVVFFYAQIGVGGPAKSNYFVGIDRGTANITPRPLTVSVTGVDKVYDGTATASVTVSDDRVAGDTFTETYNASFADKNSGSNKTVSVSGIAISGPAAGNYTLVDTTATTTASITPRPLTVSATAQNKVYDGTTDASVTLSDNRLVGDTFTDTFTSATFSDPNVNFYSSKTVTVSGIAISGPDAADYTLADSTTTTTANITPRTATLTGLIANDKVYDGTHYTTVNTSGVTITGVLPQDMQYFGYNVSRAQGYFLDVNAGNGKTVFFVNAQIGVFAPAANNYHLAIASGTANITPRPLTVSVTGVDKVYDGTTTASVTFSDNRLAGDNFTETANASFADKNAGSNKTVTVSGIGLSGPAAGDYSVVDTTTTTTANITPRPLTVTAGDASRFYGDPNPTLTGTVTGLVDSDGITITYFTDATATSPVGTYTITPTLGDPDGNLGNYTLTTTGGTLTVSPRPVTVAADATGKTFGAADPPLTFHITSGSLVGADAFSGALARDSGEGVGTYAINQGSLSLGGNYALDFVAASFVISKATPTGAVGPDNLVYGMALSGAQLGTSLGGVSGTFSFGNLEGTRLGAGSFTETYTFTAADANDYNTVTGSVTVNVSPAVVKVDSALMLAGSGTLPTFKISGVLGADAGLVVAAFTVTDPAGNPVTLGPGTPPGQYLIHATLSGPAAGNYQVAGTGTLFVVTVGADTDASGGQNVAFWDKNGNVAFVAKAGVLQSLDGLNLVTQGGAAFDPGLAGANLSADASALDTWLQKANAQNAAYWLSAHLAAADLNVQSGRVLGTDLVYAGNLLPYASQVNASLAGLQSGQFGYGQLGSGLTSDGFISVEDLMAAANAALAAAVNGPDQGVVTGGDPLRGYLLALAQSLQAVNNNTAFVQLPGSALAALVASYGAGQVS
jgi:hypothetical protein